ncbi:hypothetical protein [Archangium primigenium]|uniref:hypothetical protein n=1 Tax=[Archangium] primigenium TaxID=2792470 RepID=UPI00195DFBB0|nr:hypothetical protein [Archangium primigenium]MBM7118392.1 hypothetical protein [Archangium primigenium]
MRQAFLVTMSGAVLLSGCGFLGLYRFHAAERASPEEAARVDFPNSFEQGVHLSGPRMAAVKVAMDAFMPPGSRVKGDNEQLAECLSKWETYDVSVLQPKEDLFFVRFFPMIERCGLDVMVLDAGAVYAVDAKGRIVAIQ